LSAEHKLVVPAERSLSERAKTNKDVRQAAALLDYLLRQAPLELTNAWIALQARGSGWVTRVEQSLQRLATVSPDLHRELLNFRATEIKKAPQSGA
jgi:hypothetical protein